MTQRCYISPLITIKLFTFINVEMRKQTNLNLIWIIVFCLCSQLAFAQQKISGVVKDQNQNPIVAANVKVLNSQLASSTNAKGEFTLQLKNEKNVTLRVSSVGFESKELKAQAGDSNLIIVLDESSNTLSEVTVAALGVVKSTKSTTYAAQTVGGKELEVAKDPNLMNSLAGKVAGVTINRSSSGAGGSVKVVMRGSKSIQGNNNALFVVDGTPINNSSSQQIDGLFGGGRDAGDGISNLNPDDIESISVLKGATAAALYGSAAANGVVMITTKKGKNGVTKIDFSTNYVVDKAILLPKLQNSYGQTSPGSYESWGNGISNAQDNIKDFFQLGNTWTNTISASGGNEKAQSYFSYANTSSKGIMENNTLNRHNFTFKQNASLLDDKLVLQGSVNLVLQNINNRPVSGFYFNPLTGLYMFPRGLDFSNYKNNYEIFSNARNMMVQNWPFNEDIQQNPYWITNRNLSIEKRNRYIANASAKYLLTDWLSAQLRGNIDRSNDTYERKIYASTQGTLAHENGRYAYENYNYTQMYGDFLLMANKAISKDIGFNGILGTSTNISKTDGVGFDSGNIGLYYPNYFSIMNYANGVGRNQVNNTSYLNAVFGSLSFNYKEAVYLDLTLRNDWSSNLAFTPNGSYSYPSVGANALLHQLFKLPKAISYAKVRASFAVVGNSVPLYVTNPLNSINATGQIQFNTTKPFNDLKPEKTQSFEAGAELHFLNDKLTFDVTYYKSNTLNQFFSVPVPAGTGFSVRYINAGNVQNQGVETIVGYNLGKTGKDQLNWNTSINFSYNKNKILELYGDVKEVYLTSPGYSTYGSALKIGGSFGDIYGTYFARDASGRVILDASGNPTKAQMNGADAFKTFGTSVPKTVMGWNNTLTYKNFVASILLDGRFGFKVVSVTQAFLDQRGVSAESGQARLGSGVKIPAVSSTGVAETGINPDKYYHTVGGRSGFTEPYVYDGSNIRIQELSLGYNLPKSVLGKRLSAASISFVGRNLGFLMLKAPYDPNITVSSANSMQGVDVFNQPSTRSFGFNLKVSF